MKKIRQTVTSVLFLAVIQTVLCVVYNKTYTSVEYDYDGRFTGVLYWAMLMLAFLAAPLLYYIIGRLRKERGDKKATLITAFACNIIIVVIGIIGFFVPEAMANYRLLNAPSYLYYSLFSDSVMYVAVIAMVASGLFPTLFFKMGFTKKPRRNNQLNMDEVNAINNEKKDNKE